MIAIAIYLLNDDLWRMKNLRWKPLKSSVKQARSLTGILEAINLIISGLIILAALIGLFSGQVVAALICFLLGVVTYLVFKMAYIALELLTEIADDTRLQLIELQQLFALERLHHVFNLVAMRGGEPVDPHDLCGFSGLTIAFFALK